MATKAEERLQEQLEEAQETIRAQNAALEEAMAGPWQHVVLLEKRKESVMLGTPNGIMEFPIDPTRKEWKIGDTLRVSAAGAIGEAVPGLPFGPSATISEIRPAAGSLQQVEVNVDGMGKRIVYAGLLAGKLEEGDTVLMDAGGIVVKQKVNPAKPRFAFDGATGVNWSMIIGQEEAKATLREAIEGPIKHKEIYAKWGKKPLKGIALEGPPGNGKTLLAKAAATAIREQYKGAAAASAFISVKGPELLIKWVGESEAAIRGLFGAARKHKEKHGYPAIIFIDEADAVLRKRGSGRSSDMESTIVPMFLAEMDGLSESAALVLLATNRLDVLDPAVLREGRIDRKLTIGRPDQATTALMLHYYIRSFPIAKGDLNHEQLAQAGANLIFHPDRYPIGGRRHLAHEVSGAMIAGIAERASDYAIRREVTAPSEACGLTWRDLEMAVGSVWQEHVNVDQSAATSSWRDHSKQAQEA